MFKELCKRGAMELTKHASMRMLKRNVTSVDVENAIINGEVIEDYPGDYPFPSRLFLGKNGLHVVAAVGNGKLWIITAYWPSVNEWEHDLKTRKGCSKQ